MVSSKSDEIVIDGRDLLSSIRIGVKMPRMFGVRMTIATWLFNLAGFVGGLNVVVDADSEEYDADDESTWVRHSEPTSRGGDIVLVRYPEGYRLRHHGETVWSEP
ncbi:hypothetical protein [Brucella anthropi]|uniref:hypothetical protein n=1 Tax=Brucella anthropi TaxID=529 RepID=UPI00124E3C3D|nr:hypothetical protein [Brucella anthropi]KAB2781253.1 hypothetical protein F9K99_08610 [Brucella anthropi]